jgi:hypothetical protein
VAGARKTSSRVAGLVAAIAVLVWAGGVLPANADPTGTISVQVTAEGSGAVSGALVIISSNTSQQSGLTSSAGSYTSGPLSFGSYSVAVSDSTLYQNSTIYTLVISNDSPNPSQAVVLQPWPTGTASISGIVTDRSTTEPISGAYVHLNSFDTNQQFSQIRTDSSGYYQFSGLPAGTYALSVSDPPSSSSSGYVSHNDSGLDVSDGDSLSNNVELTPANGALDIHVQDASDNPVPFLFLDAVPQNDCSSGCPGGETDENGDLHLSSLGAGTYSFTLVGSSAYQTPTETVDVPANGTGTVTITLAARVTGSISGYVTDVDGNPLDNICVSATTTTGDGGGEGETVDGYYEIDDVDAGTYQLQFWDCGSPPGSYAISWLGGASNAQDSTSITISGGGDDETADIQQMTVGGSISGHIDVQTSTGVVTLPSGRAFAPTLFQQHLDGNWYPFDDPIQFVGDSTIVGDYTLGNLPEGDYRIGFLDVRTGPRAYAPLYWGGSTTVTGGTTVHVTPASTLSGIDGTVHIPRPGESATAVDDSSLSNANQEDLSSTSQTTQGSTIDVNVGPQYAGEWVSVWTHSTPTQLGSWVQVDSAGEIAVPVTDSVPVGLHKLVAETADNQVIGWSPLAVAAGSVSNSILHAAEGGSPVFIGTNTDGAPSLSLQEIENRFGPDAASLLAKYLADTGQAVPPDLSDLLTNPAPGDFDLSNFTAWLSWTGDTNVDVWGYSTPTHLGSFPVVDGKVQLTGLNLSALGPGVHHLLIVGQDSGNYKVGTFTVKSETPPRETQAKAVAPANTSEAVPAPWIFVLVFVILGAMIVVGVVAFRRRQRA